MNADRPRTLDPDAVEHLLRDHLTRRAGSAEPSLAPVGAVTHRARRRERRQVLLAGVAVVAMVAGGAAVASPWLDGSSRSLPSTTDPGPDGRWTVHDVPTRGDLSGSARWAQAARDELARVSAAENGPALLVDHTLFAGHVAGGVAMLVTIRSEDSNVPPDETPVVVLWSPSGLTSDVTLQWDSGLVMRMRASDAAPDDVVAAAVDVSGGAGFVVSVPLVPAQRVAVSTGPIVGKDASVRRSWDVLPVTDGVVVTPLDPSVPIRLPLVRVDGGRPYPAHAARRNADDVVEAFSGETAQAWSGGVVPQEATVRTALETVLSTVPVDRLSVEPVFRTREEPSGAEVVGALVRLDDGSVLQVAGLNFDDIGGSGRTKAVTTLMAGRAVSAAKATTTPFTWLDDVSYPDPDTLHARARLALPGAARVEIRDVGKRACTTERLLGSGSVDATGLATVVVDVPLACALAMKEGEDQQVFPDVVGIAFAANGTEIGRASIQPTSMYQLPDTADLAKAIAP